MNIDYREIGVNIRKMRKMEHMTQEQLAEKIGKTSVYVSQIENARRSLTLETAADIANELGFTIDSLLDGQLSHKPNSLYKEDTFLLADCDPTERSIICHIITKARDYVRDAL